LLIGNLIEVLDSSQTELAEHEKEDFKNLLKGLSATNLLNTNESNAASGAGTQQLSSLTATTIATATMTVTASPRKEKDKEKEKEKEKKATTDTE
jgi:hypothetical protein